MPESALPHLERARRVLSREHVHPSHVDAVLARGWNWILLGRPEKVQQALAGLDPERIPAERANYHLLLSQARLLMGDAQGAWREAVAADRFLAEAMSYYRARVRIAQGRALLDLGRLPEAETYLREGLSLAREGFFHPLLAQCWLLLSRRKTLAGDPEGARPYGLRALQISGRVGRPGLRAEALWNLGCVEAALGRTGQAIRFYSLCLQILRERELRLGPANRKSFRSAYIHPVESDRDRLLPPQFSHGRAYFSRLHELMKLMGSGKDQEEIGKRMLKLVIRSVPGVSARLWVRQSPAATFRLTRASGPCRRSGRHLLKQNSAMGPWLVAEKTQDYRSGGPAASVAIRLIREGELAGLLYLEREGSPFSEDEVDFLNCMGGITGERLNDSPPSVRTGRASPDGFRVDSSRVLVGEHPLMLRLFDEIRQVAPHPTTVLVTGESGTGKELVARSIHELSPRKGGPFVAINCSALPGELIESELFGYSRGSFTGAVGSKVGLVEAASGGTLFLDEISTMPANLQTRLLRVLQEKAVRRLGETHEKRVDVRIVAATNQSLARLMRKGEFREDLYHRINVHQISVPPLRERRSDIPLLVGYFLKQLGRQNGVRRRFSREALSRLDSFSFPGNVRELANIVESAWAVADGNEITAQHVALRLRPVTAPDASFGDRVPSIVEDLVSGRSDFWSAVRDPFLERELSRREVREIITAGLRSCQGSYRQVLEYFHLPQRDYKRFLAFLSHHDCKIDFRPFRRGREAS